MDERVGAEARLEVTTTAAVAGGAALARDPGGRVIFVAGALPGERVAVALTEARKDFARAQVVEVLDPSADRVVPPCPHVGRGCGGCDLQHVRAAAQPELKRTIVVDALRRIGRVPDANDLVSVGPALASTRYRTTVRGAVHADGFGFRAGGSHDVVDIDHCLVAHRLVDEIIATGRFLATDEVVIRVGDATGDRLVLVTPTDDAVAVEVEVPDDVVVVDRSHADGHEAPWIHEVVAGARLRISATSFFQARPDGAAALVDAVRELGGAELAAAGSVVDAYAGVGLFAATVVPERALVTAVEWSRSSVADARVNLAGRRATIRRSDVARWRPEPADVVVADPARTGLGRRATEVLAATGASVVVLVSCDPAAFARDVTLLRDHGFALAETRVIDLFPHTHHIEVVSRFVRDAPS